MADAYVDLTGAGSDTSPYDTWAKATALMQTGLTQAGAGGRCFVKTNASATNKDSAAGARGLASLGTVTNESFIIGCKSGTTAEPPTDSDVCVRGTDNLPILESTDNAISFTDYLRINGLSLVASTGITLGTDTIIAKDCEFSFTGTFYVSDYQSFFEGTNCEFIFGSAASGFVARFNAQVVLHGGLISGTTPTYLVRTVSLGGGNLVFYGVDLSNAGATLVDVSNSLSLAARFVNCKMPASWALSANTFGRTPVSVEAIGCDDATGLTTGDSVRQYQRDNSRGSVNHETTAVRTGGADDGGSGGFSFALTPNIDATNESGFGVETPWMEAVVEGDGTSKDVTVFIANDGASDYNTDDVRLLMLSPDDGGTPQHDLNVIGDVISGSTTAIADDTGSTWGTGGDNHQKLVQAISPDFQGVIYVKVIFCKRFAASPETLYVDPRLDVT